MTIAKSSALALCASFWVATPTYAQTPPSDPPPTAPPAAVAPVSPSLPGAAGEPKIKEIRAACAR